MGMTYEQYWQGDPYIARCFYEKERIETKRRNYEMWLQGAYFQSALASVISSAFGGKSNRANYVKEPFEILPKTKEEREADAEMLREKTAQALRQFAEQFNKGASKNG